MRPAILLVGLLAGCCASPLPDWPDIAPHPAGYRDQTIDLMAAPPADSLLAVRGDFEVLVRESDFRRFIADTQMVRVLGRDGIDSLTEEFTEGSVLDSSRILLGREDSDLREAENVVLDALIRSGKAYIRDRVGRRELTFVFASGNGLCETDEAHFYWVPDGRKVFQVYFLGSWCPHPS